MVTVFRLFSFFFFAGPLLISAFYAEEVALVKENISYFIVIT